MKKILITDSLFIFPEHEEKIRAAGYEIERLDKPEATPEELKAALKDKVGYVLGGIEHVTEDVLREATELKAISFTGIGYKDLIPAWEYATEKGIAIANVPDGPTHAVSEWAIGMAIAMNRGFFDTGLAGEKVFNTTRGLEDQNIGIIGLGRIGSHISEMIKVFRPKSVSYYSKNRKDYKEKELNLQYKELNNLLKESDVVFVCVSKDAGENFIAEKELSQIKDNSLLVSFMHPGIVNENALLKELQSGRLRAVSDNPAKSDEFKNLPFANWYSMNGSNAFNTYTELKLTSDMATDSIINLLKNGEDKYKVN